MARRLLAVALYAGLAIASTWPLASRATDRIAAGHERAVTVPLASAWALWWTGDRMTAGTGGYWDAPIFHPTDGSFAMSEPMPLLGVAAAPVQWLGGSLALAHNLILLLCLLLNGWSVYRLLRRFGLADPPAIVGGAIAVLLPYVHYQLGVLTLVPIFGLVWTVHALVDLADDPRWWRGLVLGAAFGVTYLMCGQHALFLAMTGAPAALWLVRRSEVGRQLLALVPAIGVASAMILPAALAQRAVAADHELERSAHRIELGSATLKAYARAPADAVIPLPPVVSEPRHTALLVGWWKLALALAGALWAWRRRPELRRLVGFAGTLAALAFLLSVLPRLEVAWFTPWAWLRAAIPGLDQIRSVHRFAVLVHLAVALLAAVGVAGLLGWRRARATAARTAAAASVVVVATVELWPTGHWLAAPPSADAWAPLLSWIERETDPDDVLIHAPFPNRRGVEYLAPEARAMYLQTYHRRPLGNGYSSYWPDSYRQLRRGFARFLRGDGDRLLREGGVRFVIVHRQALAQQDRVMPDDHRWIRRWSSDELAVDVYEIPREIPSTP